MNSLGNPFMCTDGYKTAHKDMYPQGTTLVYSNFTPRGGKHSNIKNSKGVISFGQQMVMKRIHQMFDDNFFMTDTREMFSEPGYAKVLKKRRDEICQDIKKEYSMYLGFDYDVSHIEALWDLGYLPIEVKSLPEGSYVPYKVPVLTVKNTHPEFFWLTNFLETLISTMLWMPMTSATTAFEYRRILAKACQNTDENAKESVNFQAHNFSMRGMAGLDATIYAGLGHATSFMGDDSLPTIKAAREYYNEEGFVVGSVPATEHSVMCSGEKDSELETFRYLMKQFPTGILSIVSDTWDLWKVLTEYLPILKDEILARDGKIVIRPDSGDPIEIICGLNSTPGIELEDSEFTNGMVDYWVTTGEEDCDKLTCKNTEYKGVIELLWDTFGGTVNEQGFKVLDPHIGAIYGDSITLERAQIICDRLADKGFASTNIVFGVGSYSYQCVTRDAHGLAMKATYIEVASSIISEVKRAEYRKNGIEVIPRTVGREIFKDPVTDDGTKKSAKGLLVVRKLITSQEYSLIDQVSWEEEKEGELQTIYKDGNHLNQTTLTEIRERVLKNL